MQVIAEADGYARLFNLLKTAEPDIILLDISLPGKNGVDILKELKQLYPRIKVLVLSMHPEDRYSVRAIKAGASGYITKDSAADQLVNAIRQIHQGGKFITRALAEQLANSVEINGFKPLHEKLSDREFQILCMIAAGLKIKVIASELSLSPATVATYRARILEKMQLKTNVDLANYVQRNNLSE